MSGEPSVTVLMTVYNGADFIRQAVDSILAQTLRDFEFVIVDDGSTDASATLLAEYAQRDPRVRLWRSEANEGLVAALNRGMDLVRSPLVARMDGDDVAHPERLERQVRYLDANPAVGAVASGYLRRYDDGSETRHTPPADHTAIRWRLLFGNVWPHPAVTFRRALVATDARAYEEVAHAEDYELWLRLADRTRLATIPDALMVIRTHQHGGISAENAGAQEQSVVDLSCEQLGRILGRTVDPGERDAWAAATDPSATRRLDLTQAARVFDLFEAFRRLPGVDDGALSVVRRRWIRRIVAAGVAQRAYVALGLSSFLRRALAADPGALLPGS